MSSSSDATSFSIAGLARENAYHKIDQEIARLQERLSAIQRLRNSLAPISQIPMELLSKIFSHTQDPVSAPLRSDLDLKTRFFVSWVCRHWRTTALATPTLWTIISQQNKNTPIQINLVEELLARSCHRNLAIDLSKPTKEVLMVCLAQMARIAHLRLLSAPRGDEIDTLSLQPTPALISLDLRNLRHIPPFSGVHPCLCHLTISNSVIISPTPLISPTLTSLHFLNKLYMPIETLLNTLTALPKLTELTLLESLQHEGVPENPVHRLALPNLQVLSMSQKRSKAMFRFLNHLNIPQASSSLIWQKIDASYSTIGVSSQFETYRDQIQFQIHHFEINNTASNISFHLSDTALHLSIPETGLRVYQEFLRRTFPRRTHKPLNKRVSPPPVLRTTNRSFRELRNLKTVTLSGNKALGVCVSQIGIGIEAKGDVPFAAMKELVIREVDGAEATSELDQLYQVLVARREAGMGLTKLVLEKCNVDVGQFEGLVDILSKLG